MDSFRAASGQETDPFPMHPATAGSYLPYLGNATKTRTGSTQFAAINIRHFLHACMHAGAHAALLLQVLIAPSS